LHNITPPTRRVRYKFPSNFLPVCIMRPTRRRMASRSAVYRPAFRALPFPFGAPDPFAPPCMRQRWRPDTAGDRHAPPARVRAPHLGLAIMGPTLRACRSVTGPDRFRSPARRTVRRAGVVPVVNCRQCLGGAKGAQGGGFRLQHPPARPLCIA
jgi:hypothetical protein